MEKLNLKEAFARQDDHVLGDDGPDEHLPELPRIAARQRKPKVSKRKSGKRKRRVRKTKTVGSGTVKRRKKRKGTKKAKQGRFGCEKEPKLHIRQNDEVIVMDVEPTPKAAKRASNSGRNAASLDILGSIMSGQERQFGSGGAGEAARKEAAMKEASKKEAERKDVAKREAARKEAAQKEAAQKKAAMNGYGWPQHHQGFPNVPGPSAQQPAPIHAYYEGPPMYTTRGPGGPVYGHGYSMEGPQRQYSAAEIAHWQDYWARMKEEQERGQMERAGLLPPPPPPPPPPEQVQEVIQDDQSWSAETSSPSKPSKGPKTPPEPWVEEELRMPSKGPKTPPEPWVEEELRMPSKGPKTPPEPWPGQEAAPLPQEIPLPPEQGPELPINDYQEYLRRYNWQYNVEMVRREREAEKRQHEAELQEHGAEQPEQGEKPKKRRTDLSPEELDVIKKGPQPSWGTFEYGVYLETLITPQLSRCLDKPTRNRVLRTVAAGAKWHSFNAKQCYDHLMGAYRHFSVGFDDNRTIDYPLTATNVPATYRMMLKGNMVIRVEGDEEAFEDAPRPAGCRTIEEYEAEMQAFLAETSQSPGERTPERESTPQRQATPPPTQATPPSRQATRVRQATPPPKQATGLQEPTPLREPTPCLKPTSHKDSTPSRKLPKEALSAEEASLSMMVKKEPESAEQEMHAQSPVVEQLIEEENEGEQLVDIKSEPQSEDDEEDDAPIIKKKKVIVIDDDDDDDFDDDKPAIKQEVSTDDLQEIIKKEIEEEVVIKEEPVAAIVKEAVIKAKPEVTVAKEAVDVKQEVVQKKSKAEKRKTVEPTKSDKRKRTDAAPSKPEKSVKATTSKRDEIVISDKIRMLASISPNSLISSVLQTADSPLTATTTNSQSSSSPASQKKSASSDSEDEQPRAKLPAKYQSGNEKNSKQTKSTTRSKRPKTSGRSSQRVHSHRSASPTRSSASRHVPTSHRQSTPQRQSVPKYSTFLAFGQNGVPLRRQDVFQARQAEIAMHIERMRKEEEEKRTGRGGFRGRGRGHFERGGNFGAGPSPRNGFNRDSHRHSRSPPRNKSPRRCRSMAPDRERSVSPPIQRRPPSPPMSRRQASPPNQRRTLSPQIQRRSRASPQRQQNPSPPISRRQASSSSKRKHNAPPQQPRNHSSTLNHRQASTPSQERNVAPPQRNRNHPAPVLHRQASQPNHGRHHTSESQRRHNSPPVQRQTTSPPIERRPPSPSQSKPLSPARYIAPAVRPASRGPHGNGRARGGHRGSGQRRTPSPTGSPPTIGRFQDHRSNVRNRPLSERIQWNIEESPGPMNHADRR